MISSWTNRSTPLNRTLRQNIFRSFYDPSKKPHPATFATHPQVPLLDYTTQGLERMGKKRHVIGECMRSDCLANVNMMCIICQGLEESNACLLYPPITAQSCSTMQSFHQDLPAARTRLATISNGFRQHEPPHAGSMNRGLQDITSSCCRKTIPQIVFFCSLRANPLLLFPRNIKSSALSKSALSSLRASAPLTFGSVFASVLPNMWFIPKENPEGRAFMTVIIIFLVLAAFFSSLRIWARRICKASLDTSDYTCFLGLVSIPMHFRINLRISILMF